MRFFFFCLALLLCICGTAFLQILFFIPRAYRRRAIALFIRFFGRIFIFLLGIRVKISGKLDVLFLRGAFLVSNHLGYLDGIILTSIFPLVFVARADLRTWPVFGFFSFLSNTIFVNRTNPGNIRNEIARIQSFLKDRVNVVLFPEGTSTDGMRMNPFKSSFFEAPLQAQASILPIAITYRYLDDVLVDETNKDHLYWYGDMRFFPHFFRLFQHKSIDVTVDVAEPIAYEENVQTRKDVCNLVRKSIQESLQAAQRNSSEAVEA